MVVCDTARGDSSEVNRFATGAIPLMVSHEVRANLANASFGLGFLGNETASGLLALVKVDNNGASEQIRFFAGFNATTGAAGAVVGSAMLALSALSAGTEFQVLRFEYTVHGTTPTIKIFDANGLIGTSALAVGIGLGMAVLGLMRRRGLQ